MQSTYSYDAFGNIVSQTGTINSPFRYAGYQYDDESDLYYLNARYYDPKIARFLSEDTYAGKAEDPLSLNRYMYVNNEPVMYYDPTGHWCQSSKGSHAGSTPDKCTDPNNFIPDSVYYAHLGLQTSTKPLVDTGSSNSITSTNSPSSGGKKTNLVENTSSANTTSNSQPQIVNYLMQQSDIDLDPAVQQVISYYDDIVLYAHVALDQGIINTSEYNRLMLLCKNDIDELRKSNKFDEELLSSSDVGRSLTTMLGSTVAEVGWTIVDISLLTIPVIDVITGVLIDPTPASAATRTGDTLDKINKNQGIIEEILAKDSKYGAKYTVYELYDDEGKVKYIGRTRQDIRYRLSQHELNDSVKRGLNIRVARIEGKPLTNLSYSEGRGLESKLYEMMLDKEGKLLNRIKPLDLSEIDKGTKKGLKALEYLKKATAFLKK
ncbi:RHS repeat-associated core domain-containing protein [Cohnella fermenti]|uniref:RHS repeat-associated core domain-containing protein n=1 Tax=Cohnella fermenti TaxID=2565925 RepID=UPI001E63D01A